MSKRGRKVFDMGRGLQLGPDLTFDPAGNPRKVGRSEALRDVGVRLGVSTAMFGAALAGTGKALARMTADARSFERSIDEVRQAASGSLGVPAAALGLTPKDRADQSFLERLRNPRPVTEAQIVGALRHLAADDPSPGELDRLLDEALPAQLVGDRGLRDRLLGEALGVKPADPEAVDFAEWRDDLDGEVEP